MVSFSKTAKDAIEKAGGKAEVITLKEARVSLKKTLSEPVEGTEE